MSFAAIVGVFLGFFGFFFRQSDFDETRLRAEALRTESWDVRKDANMLCICSTTEEAACRQAGVGGAAAVAVLSGLADDDRLAEECGCEQP